MWYLSDLARFKEEREGLESLGARAAWLTPIRWRVDASMRLIFDVDLVVGTHTWAMSLVYPAHFPNTPPSVLPRGDNSRWSSHQFGPGGELCLEYRPDNWTPDRTGVDMLESAHRLLSTENPPSGDRGAVASAHEVTLGQMLRVTYMRLLMTRELEIFFSLVPIGSKLTGSLLALYRENVNIYVVDSVTMANGEDWPNASVPPLRFEAFGRPVAILRVPDSYQLPKASDFPAFLAGMSDLGLGQDDKIIVILKGSEVHGFIVLDTQVAALTTVEAQPYSRRLDESHEMLGAKSMAVVGCGSMGSKIATMLARSGVGSFFLVDDDVLLPDNLVRHDLDWRDVGSHKAEALADRLRRVNPAAKVNVRNIRMAGQESSGSAETTVASLAACELIVDATANPDVFNLLANLVENIKKPVIWAEVFSGGFGGLIARCRPDIEPPLQLMRRSIENWFQDRDYEPQRMTRSYEADRDGVPMIADDADVTSIAAPAARLAIDTLLAREPSYFPHSAYVIGLGPEEKLFSQAFQTYPIDLGEAPPLAERPRLSQEEAAAEIGEIAKMFENKCG